VGWWDDQATGRVRRLWTEAKERAAVDRARQSPAEQMAAECRAYLDGRLAEHLEASRGAAPVWTWTNLLAHGTPLALRAVAQGSAGGGRDWRRARGELARDVLALAGRAGPLRRIQFAVLLPLEDTLAVSGAAVLWRPTEWADRVQAALEGWEATAGPA
jgi:hypothetical protein